MKRLNFLNIASQALLFILFVLFTYPLFNSSSLFEQKSLINELTHDVLPLMVSLIVFSLIFREATIREKDGKVEQSSFNLNLVKSNSLIQGILFIFLFYNFKEFDFKYGISPSLVLFSTCYFISFATSWLFILYLKKDVKNHYQQIKEEGLVDNLFMPVLLTLLLSISVYLSFFEPLTLNLFDDVINMPVIIYFVLTQILGLGLSYLFFSNNFFDKRTIENK